MGAELDEVLPEDVVPEGVLEVVPVDDVPLEDELPEDEPVDEAEDDEDGTLDEDGDSDELLSGISSLSITMLPPLSVSVPYFDLAVKVTFPSVTSLS